MASKNDNHYPETSARQELFQQENPANPASTDVDKGKYRNKTHEYSIQPLEALETDYWYDKTVYPRPFGMVYSGRAHEYCGTWETLGCEQGAHVILGSQTPKIYTESHQIFCGRPLCPTCGPIWAEQIALKSEKRYQLYLQLVGRTPSKRHHFWLLHIVVSGTRNRDLIYKVLKEAGVLGGSMVEHPWARPPFQHWTLRHHWHVLGIGWTDKDKIKEIYQKYKIVIKVIKGSQRRSWYDTIHYELTHCVARHDGHAMRWWGVMAYNKFPNPKVTGDKKERACPRCGSRLVPLVFKGPESFNNIYSVGPWRNPNWYVYKTSGKPPPIVFDD